MPSFEEHLSREASYTCKSQPGPKTCIPGSWMLDYLETVRDIDVAYGVILPSKLQRPLSESPPPKSPL